MYGALWRAMPGPAWLKAIIFLMLAVAVVYLLFEYVFPWVATLLPEPDNTVEQ